MPLLLAPGHKREQSLNLLESLLMALMFDGLGHTEIMQIRQHLRGLHQTTADVFFTTQFETFPEIDRTSITIVMDKRG